MRCADFNSQITKTLDKNLTIMILYREVKCVENDENVRILKVKLQNIG